MTDSKPTPDMEIPPVAVTEGVSERVPHLRFYIARMTPNSVLAEQHLLAVLRDFPDRDCAFELEIIDVLTKQRRAIADGIIVTPTLIGSLGSIRKIMLGDLTNRAQLIAFLRSLKTISDG